MNVDIIHLGQYYVNEVDLWLTTILRSNSFTLNLISTPLSKYITEIILVVSGLLLVSEFIYWTGIYMQLWEYHAKDIFTEIPIHCAHVYVRLNVSHRKNIKLIDDYYEFKQKSKYNFLNWKSLLDKKNEAFINHEFITYHFEFSPEDFEMNSEPEFGSTISHLRQKTLDLFNSSSLSLFKDLKQGQSITDVLIFNKYSDKIDQLVDDEYLIKCSIETGDVIDCIILCG